MYRLMGTAALVHLSRNFKPKLQKLLLNLVIYYSIQKTLGRGIGLLAGSHTTNRAVRLISVCSAAVARDLSFSGGSFAFTWLVFKSNINFVIIHLPDMDIFEI